MSMSHFHRRILAWTWASDIFLFLIGSISLGDPGSSPGVCWSSEHGDVHDPAPAPVAQRDPVDNLKCARILGSFTYFHVRGDYTYIHTGVCVCAVCVAVSTYTYIPIYRYGLRRWIIPSTSTTYHSSQLRSVVCGSKFPVFQPVCRMSL